MTKFQKAINKLKKYGWSKDNLGCWDYSAIILNKEHSYKLILNKTKRKWIILRTIKTGKIGNNKRYRDSAVMLHDDNSHRNINFCMTDGTREKQLINKIDEIYNAATQLRMDLQGEYISSNRLCDFHIKEIEKEINKSRYKQIRLDL